MAGIIANTDGDIQKLRALKNEIENVKKSLKGINVKVDIDIKEQAEKRLQELTKEYDELGRKVSETTAKIDRSAQNIINATSKITQAQEKLSKAAMGTSSGKANADTSGTKAQTESVKAQAKAYLDLKDDIDAVLGTREDNIHRMVEEQNAIRLINAEISRINKSEQWSGDLSSTQKARLDALNNSLLQHKTALSEVRQSLANNAKMDISAATSMNEMSQSLSRMRIAYRSLSEEERNSPFGKELLASIQQADAKIKELDSSIGNNQRNVGNYKMAWNGLDMSVQQIVRELPSLKMGINMFFLAISNNLPILTDEIKRTREMNAAMKAAGKEPVPVWKQLTKSLVSWQTVMMVGITLLTVYGKDILNWVKNLFTAKDALTILKKAEKENTDAMRKFHQEWATDVADSASKQITEYKKLQREWNKLGNNMKAKKFFIRANQSAFNDLGYSVNNVTQAESILVKNTSAVVNAIMARAKAAATQDEVTKVYKRYIEKEINNKGTVNGGGFAKIFHAQKFHGETVYKMNASDLDTLGLKKDQFDLVMNNVLHPSHVMIRFHGTEAQLNAISKARARQRYKNNTQTNSLLLHKNLSLLDSDMKSSANSLLKSNKIINVPSYNSNDAKQEKADTRAEKAAERKHLAAERRAEHREEADRKRKEANAQKEAASEERVSEIKTKAQLDSERKDRDLSYDTTQAEIDAMRDGSEKKLRQLDLDKTKELDKVNRDYEDLRQARIDNAKKLWGASRKKGNFYKSSAYTYAASDDRYTDAQKGNRKAHISAVYATYNKGVYDESSALEKSMNDYLKAFGSVQQQRAAIAAEYDQKIAETADVWAKRTLEQQKETAVSIFDFSQFKKSINWEEVFGNLSDLSLKTLRDLKVKMQKELSQDMNPTDYKTIVDSINQIDDQISKKGHKLSTFLGINVPELDRIKRAQEDVITYQKQLNDLLIQQHNIETGIAVDQQAATNILANGGVEVNPSEITEKNRQKILSYASSPDKKAQIQKIFDDIIKDQKDLADNKQNQQSTASRKTLAESVANTKGFDRIKAGSEWISQQYDKGIGQNIQSLPMALKNLGVKENSGLYKGMEQFAQASNDVSNAFKSLVSGDVVGTIGNIAGAFKSLGNSVVTWFGLDGNNAKRIKRWQNTVEKYQQLDKVWDSLIQKKKEYLNMSWGSEADKTEKEIQKLMKAENEGTKAEAESWLNTKAKHHAASHTQWTWMSRHWGGQQGFDNVVSDLNAKGFTKDANGDKISISSVMDFFKLTEDELYQVKEDFHDIWATQDTTFSGYLDNYIKGLSNMTDASQNAVDKVVGSVSDLSSLMENLAKSSKTTVADVSNSFNDLYNNEVWQGLTQEGTDYYTKMVQFQKDFKKSEDNKTLEKDASALKKEYLDAYKEAKDKYDSITSAAGTDTSEQSATANGISSISYEQASNIEGITTAINVEVSQSKDEAIKIGSIADETRTLIAEGHTELIGIHNDTSSIDKRIKDLASDVSDIKKNVKNM
jgi:hypothetical protein